MFPFRFRPSVSFVFQTSIDVLPERMCCLLEKDGDSVLILSWAALHAKKALCWPKVSIDHRWCFDTFSSTGYEVPLRTTRAFLLELEKHIFESSSSIAPYLSYINGHRTGSGHDLYVVEKKCWHNTQYDEDCAAQAYLHLFPLRYSGFSCSFPSTSVL